MRTFIRKGSQLPRRFFDRKSYAKNKEFVVFGIDSINQGSKFSPAHKNKRKQNGVNGLIVFSNRRKMNAVIKGVYFSGYPTALLYK